jgi:hypothetical protein
VIEEALNSLLSNDAPLTTLIGSRVYLMMAPQNVPAPYLVFLKVVELASGTLCAQDPMVRSLFQFDSYAKVGIQALRVAKVMRDSLIDFRGTVDGTYIASIRKDNEMDVLEPEPGLFRVSTSLFIWHGD